MEVPQLMFCGRQAGGRTRGLNVFLSGVVSLCLPRLRFAERLSGNIARGITRVEDSRHGVSCGILLFLPCQRDDDAVINAVMVVAALVMVRIATYSNNHPEN